MLNLHQQDAVYVLEPLKNCPQKALRAAARRFLRLAAQDHHESMRQAEKGTAAVVAALQK